MAQQGLRFHCSLVLLCCQSGTILLPNFVTKISVFGTDSSENPRFSVSIFGTNAKHKNMLIKNTEFVLINKVKQKCNLHKSMPFFVLI